ncbi:MAG TPA: TolC family protein, partial [Candidatus Limnocylindria bacterium]|nr:TolC family protein [Candidatus Limnocylindria bacterium]
MSRTRYLAIAAVAWGGLASAQEAPRPITLDEAVQLAQRNAPTAVQSRGQLRTSDATVRGAYASFLPDVNLNMSRSWEGGTRTIQAGRPVGDESPWSSSAGASMSIQLFDGGSRFYEL